jgi:hypothetical protein
LVAELGEEELAAFADWFERLQSERWDKRIEADADAGKLDKLADKALAAHRAGHTQAL